MNATVVSGRPDVFQVGMKVRITGSRIWGTVTSVGHMYITIYVDRDSCNCLALHPRNLTYPRERLCTEQP